MINWYRKLDGSIDAEKVITELELDFERIPDEENHIVGLFDREAVGLAVELLKAQEPRVMAIEELEETGEPVFIELKTKGDDDKALTCFGLLSEWDNLAFHFIVDQWLLDGEPFFKIYGCELKRKEYNIQWRPWNKLPTIKQMKAAEWDG